MSIRVDIKALQSGRLSQNIVAPRRRHHLRAARRTVYVFGQVNNPGGYPLQRTRRCCRRCRSPAASPTAAPPVGFASSRVVDGKKNEVNVKLDDIVQPGDTIIVPERFF